MKNMFRNFLTEFFFNKLYKLTLFLWENMNFKKYNKL